MKKNSGFKLRSGNKPSIAKFMGLKDIVGKKGFELGAINMLANLFGKGKGNDTKKTDDKKTKETKELTAEERALKVLESFKK